MILKSLFLPGVRLETSWDSPWLGFPSLRRYVIVFSDGFFPSWKKYKEKALNVSGGKLLVLEAFPKSCALRKCWCELLSC